GGDGGAGAQQQAPGVAAPEREVWSETDRAPCRGRGSGPPPGRLVPNPLDPCRPGNAPGNLAPASPAPPASRAGRQAPAHRTCGTPRRKEKQRRGEKAARPPASARLDVRARPTTCRRGSNTAPPPD